MAKVIKAVLREEDPVTTSPNPTVKKNKRYRTRENDL
jgi:hypothetical protein